MSGISFDGQAAIVTGSGRGLGRAYALALADRGAKVVVNDIAVDVANSVVAEIEAAGGAAVACTESAGTLEGTRAIVDTAVEAFGGLDVLVNNAGYFGYGYFEDIKPEQAVEMINVHLLGYFWLTQYAWPLFREKGYGRVVMTSSQAIFGHPGFGNYAAAKGGVIGLTNALSNESLQYGIRVNAILPSARTQDYRRKERFDIDNPEAVRAFAERTNMMHGRVQPELNAHMVLYLASRECTCNGEAFHAAAGSYERVFLGLTRGWVAEDADALSPDVIAAHIDEIMDLEGSWVPGSTYEPNERIAERLDELLGPYEPE